MNFPTRNWPQYQASPSRDNFGGFDKFQAYLLGETDGTPKTAEWAADVCGVDADVLRQLARDMAKNRTMIMGGDGGSQSGRTRA